MNNTWKRLQREFVEDHRALTRGYLRLLQLLDKKKFAEVASEAKRIDQLAGPHIAFEEKFLYPRVGKSRGTDYTRKLYDEHAEILGVLIELRQLDPDSRLNDDAIESLKVRLQHGLDHAATCGSLLSHLKGLNEDEQKASLDKLLALRESGTTWTNLRSHKGH